MFWIQLAINISRRRHLRSFRRITDSIEVETNGGKGYKLFTCSMKPFNEHPGYVFTSLKFWQVYKLFDAMLCPWDELNVFTWSTNVEMVFFSLQLNEKLNKFRLLRVNALHTEYNVLFIVFSLYENRVAFASSKNAHNIPLNFHCLK